MKRTITMLVSALLLFPSVCFSQAPAIEWQNTIGGNKIDLLYAIQTTADGGSIVGGSSNSGPTGDKSQGNKGGFDYWVMKLDQNGSVVWEKTIGGSNLDYLKSIVKCSDGGYLIGGASRSGISGDKTQGAVGNYDFWILKLDPDGNILWDKTFGGKKGDYLNTMIQTTDGGYLLAGHSESNISGSKSENARGWFDYWVVKIDESGNLMWDKTLGSTNSEYLYAVLQTSDGKYYLAGSSGSKAGGEKTEDSKGYSDYWLVKLNEDGTVAWDKTLGGAGNEFCYAIRKISGGGFIIGGYSDSDISGDKSEDSKGSYDYWVVKTDQSGNLMWDKTIGGDDEDELYDLVASDDGGFLLGGYSESGISADKTEASRGDYDYWVVKIDAASNVVWDKTLGGNDEEELLAVRRTSDGNYLIAGYSYSNASGDKSENNTGGSDFWIVKLGAGDPPRLPEEQVHSGEAPFHISIFPNPTSGTFTVIFSELPAEMLNVEVTNLSGQIVHACSGREAGVTEMKIDLPRELPPGMYFINVESGSKKYGSVFQLQR